MTNLADFILLHYLFAFSPFPDPADALTDDHFVRVFRLYRTATLAQITADLAPQRALDAPCPCVDLISHEVSV